MAYTDFSKDSGAAVGEVLLPGVGGAIGGQAGEAQGKEVASVLTWVQDTWKKFGSLFSGSAPVDWNQANDLATPTATQVVKSLGSSFSDVDLKKIFDSYTAKLKSYVKDSPHNPTERDNTIKAIDVEAIGCGGGFKPNGFPFASNVQVQLAWAIWLHAHWLYGGVSLDEVGNGNALRKFNESLTPTLVLAIQEQTGQTVTVTGSKTEATPAKTDIKIASFFSNPLVLLGLVGAVIAIVISKGKR